MNKYTFRIYTVSDPEDGFNAWTEAFSRYEAEEKIKREYHSIVRLSLMNIQKID